MMIEKVRKRSSSLFADVRGIVYNNVKSVQSGLISDFRQKSLISVAALEDLNTLSRPEVLRQLTIDANDSTAREIVAPQFERTSSLNTNLQERNLFVDPWCHNCVLHVQIAVPYFISFIGIKV
jgi:hypothetical protein